MNVIMRASRTAKPGKRFCFALALICCLPALLLTLPGDAPAQAGQGNGQISLPAIAPDKLSGASAAEVFSTLVDDRVPGIVRLGSIQILYGTMDVPCAPPAEVCQVTVRFPVPFVEPPLVSFTNVAHYQTQKVANAWLYKDRLSATQFTARVSMQANVKDLRVIPWLAIGRWR